jgi:serine/threonine protein kinase
MHSDRRFFTELEPDSFDFPSHSNASEPCKCIAKEEAVFIRSEPDISPPASPSALASHSQTDVNAAVLTCGSLRVKYNPQEPASVGRNACIYKGEHEGKAVAVKVFNDDLDSKEAAMAELQALALTHDELPFVKLVFSIIPSGESAAAIFVLDWLGGYTLDRYMAVNDETDGTELIYQIAHALHILHGHGIVHHDLKPHNIMVHDHAVRMIDFGDSKLLKTHSQGTDSLPISKSVGLGTLAYTAPELLANSDSLYDPFAADVYSFGVLMYYILNRGRVEPWPGYLPRRSVHLIIASRKGFFTSGDNCMPPSTDTAWSLILELMHDCLSLDPKKRPTAAACFTRLGSIKM